MYPRLSRCTIPRSCLLYRLQWVSSNRARHEHVFTGGTPAAQVDPHKREVSAATQTSAFAAIRAVRRTAAIRLDRRSMAVRARACSGRSERNSRDVELLEISRRGHEEGGCARFGEGRFTSAVGVPNGVEPVVSEVTKANCYPILVRCEGAFRGQADGGGMRPRRSRMSESKSSGVQGSSDNR